MSDYELLCADCDSPYHLRCAPVADDELSRANPSRAVSPDAVVDELARLRAEGRPS